jgi:hypothetical protein
MNSLRQERYFRIRQGYNDPCLGDIGGWEVVGIRSITLDGAIYFDTELTEKTLTSLSEEIKAQYYWKKYIFTRIRIAQKDTTPIEFKEDLSRRYKVFNQIQKDWFKTVGTHETDPTKTASDEEYDSTYDGTRREAMKIMAFIGIGLLIVAISQCNDCNNNGSQGSWGRSGGGYSS